MNIKKRIFSAEHRRRLSGPKSEEQRKKMSEAKKDKTKIDIDDIVGNKYGILTVVKFLEARKERKPWKYIYECICECGTIRSYVRTNLITNHTLSCGCLKTRKGNKSKSWKGFGDVSSSLFTHIKHGAEVRNLPFDITIEQAWEQFQKQNGLCELTKRILVMDRFKNNRTDRTASLDRIDSSRGYTVDNIQWVHKDVNRAKQDFSQEDFIQMCKEIAAAHN